MGLFDSLKKGLTKARSNFTTKILKTFMQHKFVTEELYEELEEALITADVSAELAMDILDKLKDKAIEKRITDTLELYELLQEEMSELIPQSSPLQINQKKMNIVLVVGVNGVGKTTSIGKISGKLVQEGKKVMLVAADTFRAAAADQLSIWAERSGSLIVRHGEGGDPAAVIYDAIHSARAKDIDVLLVDTAGRLHNKKNLMNELSKIHKVLNREVPGAPHETLLVIDATTGQNGLMQAEAFNEAANISGLVLTKMDGTAKGGIIFNISKEYNIPVKYVCIGEKIEDMIPFDREEFIRALFSKEE
ncbi:signal recognition particle-docking protein FtsY [Clostridium sp. 'deep sea']|uniref:signal recognition particle-docking protein FtsY n=1 Tax=Clostridium sp. 'deep sea' TaxID=2779445 RepID=UPI001896442E|nr:signal recognition particle-docking protein FtsY [Clostridium sp. 'deep sea']QOR36074.1 signal recognition particle-docking protein FtsY [Clostridium sp. 'deep sea']